MLEVVSMTTNVEWSFESNCYIGWTCLCLSDDSSKYVPLTDYKTGIAINPLDYADSLGYNTQNFRTKGMANEPEIATRTNDR